MKLGTLLLAFFLKFFLGLFFSLYFLRSLIKLQMAVKQDETYVVTWSVLPHVQEHIAVCCFYFVNCFIYHSSLTILWTKEWKLPSHLSPSDTFFRSRCGTWTPGASSGTLTLPSPNTSESVFALRSQVLLLESCI